MLRIDTDGAIRLTRGDDAYLTFRAYNADGVQVDVMDYDIMMTMRDGGTGGDVVFAVTADMTGDEPVIHITPTETADVAQGVYDIQGTSEGETTTFVDATPIEIIADVTR